MIDGPRFGNDFAFVWNEQFVYILQNIRRERLSLFILNKQIYPFCITCPKKKEKGRKK